MIKLFEFIGDKIKFANPWIDDFSVNCFQLPDGRVVNLIGYEKTDSTIDDSKGKSFYLRINPRFEYTPLKQLSSFSKEYRVAVRFRFLFYVVDSDFDFNAITLENTFVRNFREIGFSDYSGVERQIEIVIKNSSVDIPAIYFEETKKEFRSGSDLRVVAVDCELRFTSSNDCVSGCGASTSIDILKTFNFCDDKVFSRLTEEQKECLISKLCDNMTLQEIPLESGVVDGVNNIFVWTEIPLQVFLNGQLLKEGAGYTLTGKTTTLTNAPFAGESIWAYGNY